MIVDASALFAVLNGEAEADRIAAALARTRTRLMSAGTLLEAGIVAEASGPGRADDLDDLIAHYKIDIVPFTASQAALAVRRSEPTARAATQPG